VVWEEVGVEDCLSQGSLHNMSCVEVIATSFGGCSISQVNAVTARVCTSVGVTTDLTVWRLVWC
jgi:hypothetical protein